MIKITKKSKRKNPNVNFYKILEKLIGKTVIIRVNHPSNNFYFTIEGILENTGHHFKVNFDNKELAQIYFNEKMVKSIENNFIEVKTEPNDEVLEEIKVFSQGRVHILPSDVLDQTVNVVLASKLRWPFIQGKLKYNKVNKFYYIQDYNHLIQLRFTENMIFNVKRNNVIWFEIISEDVNELWKELNL